MSSKLVYNEIKYNTLYKTQILIDGKLSNYNLLPDSTEINYEINKFMYFYEENNTIFPYIFDNFISIENLILQYDNNNIIIYKFIKQIDNYTFEYKCVNNSNIPNYIIKFDLKLENIGTSIREISEIEKFPSFTSIEIFKYQIDKYINKYNEFKQKLINDDIINNINIKQKHFKNYIPQKFKNSKYIYSLLFYDDKYIDIMKNKLKEQKINIDEKISPINSIEHINNTIMIKGTLIQCIDQIDKFISYLHEFKKDIINKKYLIYQISNIFKNIETFIKELSLEEIKDEQLDEFSCIYYIKNLSCNSIVKDTNIFTGDGYILAKSNDYNEWNLFFYTLKKDNINIETVEKYEKFIHLQNKLYQHSKKYELNTDITGYIKLNKEVFDNLLNE